MILPILARLTATFYLIAPVVAIIMVLIDPPIAWAIFLVWIASAGTVVGLAFIVVSLVYIWRDLDE